MGSKEKEKEIVARSLAAVVDIGSNGVRFSISSLASHHVRIIPCVYQDRLSISLFDAQYSVSVKEQKKNQTHKEDDKSDFTIEKQPIDPSVIDEIIYGMKRFALVCKDFGVAASSVQVVATEATREASNSAQFRERILQETGWEVKLLTKVEEGTIGAYGVASSFYNISGLFLDLGGGSTQLSWIINKNGSLKMSNSPVSLPYGAAALTLRLQNENKRDLRDEIQLAMENAVSSINIPEELRRQSEEQGGYDLLACGGGFRGFGHLLLADSDDYPIPSVINGFSTSGEKFHDLATYHYIKTGNKYTGFDKKKVFRVSERRAKQLPAISLLICATLEALPKIKNVKFAQGGVREGVIYKDLPNDIKNQDPLIIATQPYGPLLSQKYLDLLLGAIPTNAPSEIRERLAPALVNVAFVHCSYPKDLQSSAALYIATTGIISGTYGLTHRDRGLIGLALCERWGGELPEADKKVRSAICKMISGSNTDDNSDWWARYCGKLMHVICGVYPGGNVHEGSLTLKLVENDNGFSITSSPRKFKNVSLKLKIETEDNDFRTASYSVRSRIQSLEKKLKKISKGSSTEGKIKVDVLLNKVNSDSK